VSEQRPPAGGDASVPSPARVYDYLLGGKDNYPVDRAVADRLLAVAPDSRLVARANRAFLQRAVRFVAAEADVGQFIDLGTGIPTSPSVHELARESDPAARVVYVDNDPLVKVHNDAKLATDPRVVTVRADIRRPEAILNAPEVQRLIDFSRPVAVLLVAVLHFVADDEDPAGIIGFFRDRIAAGSHLVLSHISSDSDPEAIRQLSAATAGTPAQSTFRSPREIGRLLAGFEVLPPGLVTIQQWRPDMNAPTTRLDVQAAVARKN
jgi:S-adenosyl methyltransferase